MTHWEKVVHDVFDRQESLMQKYQHLEQLPAPPLSLHVAGHQRILKDFAWRVTEELAEAHEAYRRYPPGSDGWLQPVSEELADALHFLVELLIFAGVTASQCLKQVSWFPPDDNQSLEFVQWRATDHLGLAMHELRNKAWKQETVSTDEASCRRHLVLTFAAHMDIWASLGFDSEDLSRAFISKHEKNKARIDEGY